MLSGDSFFHDLRIQFGQEAVLALSGSHLEVVFTIALSVAATISLVVTKKV